MEQNFGQRVDHMNESAQTLLEEARGMVSDFSEALDIHGRLERHPYGTLLAAAGIGYVLGGGLFTSLTGSMLKVGIRLGAVPLVKNELLSMLETAIDGMARGSESGSAGGDTAPGTRSDEGASA